MNRLFTSLFALFFSTLLTANTDSVSIGAGGTNMVFYNITQHTQTSVRNDDWHIAFSCKPAAFPSNTNQSASVRINGGFGLELYRCPSQKLKQWNTFDTTGYHGWQRMQNPDTSWDVSAFNINRDTSNPFNYGWGFYNSHGHNVDGDSSIYLLKLPNGSFKKFTIITLAYDTAWVIRYDNLDNSHLVNMEIRKKPYKTKNFIYLNLQNDSIMNKEPDNTTWNLVFLKYNHDNVTADAVRDMGIFTNYYTATSLSDFVLPSQCYISSNTNDPFSINIIGKSFRPNPSIDSVIPSRFYSNTIPATGVKTSFHITGFTGATGTYVFTTCDNTTGINDLATTTPDISVYPVPAVHSLHIVFNSEAQGELELNITDMMGRAVYHGSIVTTSGSHESVIDVSNITNGQYILTGVSSAGIWHRAFTIAH